MRLGILCLLLLAFAQDAWAGPGFPEFDPRDETIIVGPDTVPESAVTLGTWSQQKGNVALTESDPAKQNFWFPEDANASMADGFVRARFKIGDRLDTSLMFRVQMDPNDMPGMSGYGLSVSRDNIAIERWEAGAVRELGEKSVVRQLRKKEAVEVVIWMIGPHISVQVYDGTSLDPVATLVVSDHQFSEGRIGIRAYVKQDDKSALTLLTTRQAGTQTGARPTPSGPDRFVWLAPDSVSMIPEGVEAILLDDTAADRVLLRTSRTGYARMKRAELPILDVVLEPRFAFVDSDYRQARAKGLVRTATGFDVDASFKDAAMVEALMAAYAERFPDICQLVELGRTHQGRPILALKISDNPGLDEDEPAVLLNGAHHGVELLSTEFVVDAMRTLIEGYADDEPVRRWVDRAEIWVVPLVNPDGAHNHFHASLFTGRKNARDTNESGQFEPLDGVDLNRNYPFAWHSSGELGSSSDVRHRWFRGPIAGSEPETQAMMRLADSERFVASISYHTWGTVILAPYTIDNVPNPSPNEAWTVAEEIAAATPEQPNGRPYVVQRNIYSVDGVDQDWFRAAHGTVALLVEGAFHNPRDRDKRLATVESNRPTWQRLLDRVTAGPSIYGTVVDRNGDAVVARIDVLEMLTKGEERWTSRCRDGRYERMLPGSGTYTVRVSGDGITPVEQTVKVSTQRKRLDFTLDVLAADLPALHTRVCATPEMCAAETYCQAQAGQCARPGAGSFCRIDGTCHAAGDTPVACLECKPERLALEWAVGAAGTECQQASCTNGVFTAAATCDAFGVCQPGGLQPCPAQHQCDGGRCAPIAYVLPKTPPPGSAPDVPERAQGDEPTAMCATQRKTPTRGIWLAFVLSLGLFWLRWRGTG